MSSRDAGSFRQPGGNGTAPSAAAPHHNNNNNNGVKFAGEESKDKMYEPKHTKKLVRVLTVVAYIFSVSLAAIMLSVYYVFLWQPRDQHALHARVRGGGAAAATGQTAAPTSNRSSVTPSLESPLPPSPAPVACECPPSQSVAADVPDADTPSASTPQQQQHHHHHHHEQKQPVAVPPLPAPEPDEISTSQIKRGHISTTQTPERDFAEPVQGLTKSKQQVTDIPQASREGQRLPFRSFQNALQV